MLASTTLTLPQAQPKPGPCEPNIQATSSHTRDPHQPPKVPPRKLKPSPKLALWSRARTLRSGKKLDRVGPNPAQIPTPTPTPDPNISLSNNNYSATSPPDDVASSNNIIMNSIEGVEGDEDEGEGEGKAIYMVSDGTGWTAEHSVNAALGQFEHCLVDRGCSVNTHLFSGIEDVERLMEIVKQAAKEGAILVYTLADPSMAQSAKKASQLWGVPSTDVLGPITEAIASHLGVSPSGLPRGAQGRTLTEDYFKRIEAIEFTIKQDDGALPQNLHLSDIVLTGVSRTGKTPLSIYLAQKGYKVANIPIVMGVNVPKTLFEVDQDKVFGLTINPLVLQSIRKSRAKTLGLGENNESNYSQMDYVRRELEHAGKIFAQNPRWPVIEVTSKAVEETAAVILRLYHDRKQKCSMPRISKRY